MTPSMSDYLGTLEVNAQVLLNEVQRLRALHAAGNLPQWVTKLRVENAENYTRQAMDTLKRDAVQKWGWGYSE